MKKQQIRIACWNIKTLYSKDHELIPELNEHKIDICALSETKKKGKGTTKLNSYISIYSGVPKDQRATSGVGVSINDKYEQNIESIEYVCDRILRVKIMFDQPIHIILVYAPDINKPEEMSIDFYENLQSAIDKIPRHKKIILLGDLNARIGNEVVDGIKQKYNENITNRNGEILTEFCGQNELRINTYFPHKEQHKYTFYGNRKIKDYIITNRSFLPQQIIDIRVLSSANIGTDHKLVLGKIRIGAPLSKEYEIKQKKFNIESLNHESTKQLYSNRCQTHVTLNPIAQFDTPKTAWNKLKRKHHKRC
ncbi:craniofacial development protein 2-like [Sitophilus oryzae]|uniref:Craniofacial development protein 2-like n=1 Tax=Sitophilus oryzae TaxID=7048 RepID=A0A6J2YVV2_SITOR|nr:craniofacial development protein 2-like [Sitophilus oryzae]